MGPTAPIKRCRTAPDISVNAEGEVETKCSHVLPQGGDSRMFSQMQGNVFVSPWPSTQPEVTGMAFREKTRGGGGGGEWNHAEDSTPRQPLFGTGHFQVMKGSTPPRRTQHLTHRKRFAGGGRGVPRPSGKLPAAGTPPKPQGKAPCWGNPHRPPLSLHPEIYPSPPDRQGHPPPEATLPQA